MPYVVEIVERDITTADAEVIVNAANNQFWMGSGVAGAIKAKGGAVVEKEAMAKGPVFPGEAVATTAGLLRYKYVIHAAVMGQDLRTTDKLIRKATLSSLRLAVDLRISSLAFPAFGTGVGGFPVTACAFVMLQAVKIFEPEATHLTRIQFCLLDPLALTAFRNQWEKTKDTR